MEETLIRLAGQFGFPGFAFVAIVIIFVRELRMLRSDLSGHQSANQQEHIRIEGELGKALGMLMRQNGKGRQCPFPACPFETTKGGEEPRRE